MATSLRILLKFMFTILSTQMASRIPIQAFKALNLSKLNQAVEVPVAKIRSNKKNSIKMAK